MEIDAGEKLLDSKGKWSWCGLCDCAILTCDECKNSSCNGGGCCYCIDLHEVWRAHWRGAISLFTWDEIESSRKIHAAWVDEVFGPQPVDEPPNQYTVDKQIAYDKMIEEIISGKTNSGR